MMATFGICKHCDKTFQTYSQAQVYYCSECASSIGYNISKEERIWRKKAEDAVDRAWEINRHGY
jgi:predicted amidophosphoribosyltransferase